MALELIGDFIVAVLFVSFVLVVLLLLAAGHLKQWCREFVSECSSGSSSPLYFVDIARMEQPTDPQRPTLLRV